MIIDQKEFKLRDGRTAVIRSPREEDVRGVYNYHHTNI